ncbi:MAG: hypothetical protein IPN83_01380 [Holophagales bacterium]|jgi:hypothetical protein|nr:hypothetical protein [Holophagales bacterium]
MKRVPFAGAAGLALLLLRGPAAADTPATTQWILATARATGRGGEEFVSSLRIVNPFPQAANVDLTYLAQSPFDAAFSATGDNGAAAKVRVTVGPRATLAIEDVVGTTFAGLAAPFGIQAGGLRVDSDIPVSVLSRTFVANARSSTGAAGTFGFSIPAQSASQTVAAGETAWLPYVSSSPSASSGFRTNVILLNTGPASTVVNVALLRGDGSEAAPPRDYTLGRASTAQQTDVGASFGVPGTETNLRVVVTVRSGGPVAIGASLIDNAISSIAYLPPAKLDEPDDGAYGWVVTRGDASLASAGRLDVRLGVPNFLSGLLVVDCEAGPFVHSFLAFGVDSGVTPNTSFTPMEGGGFRFAGSSLDSGAWSGTVLPWIDGSVFGSLTFTTLATARCSGVTRSYEFAGAKAFGFGEAP